MCIRSVLAEEVASTCKSHRCLLLRLTGRAGGRSGPSRKGTMPIVARSAEVQSHSRRDLRHCWLHGGSCAKRPGCRTRLCGWVKSPCNERTHWELPKDEVPKMVSSARLRERRRAGMVRSVPVPLWLQDANDSALKVRKAR